MCSFILWEVIVHRHAGNVSEQLCWPQCPKSAQQTPHLVPSDSGWPNPQLHVWATLSTDTPDRNHSSTMVRLLTANPFSCLSTSALLGIATFSSSKLTHTAHSRLAQATTLSKLLPPATHTHTHTHTHLSVGQKSIVLRMSLLRLSA